MKRGPRGRGEDSGVSIGGEIRRCEPSGAEAPIKADSSDGTTEVVPFRKTPF